MEIGEFVSVPRSSVSNTGPLISALQCGCLPLLYQFYDLVHVPVSEVAEFEGHGAGEELRRMIDSGFIVPHTLTEPEQQVARAIAEEIAASPMSRNKDPLHHYPEAEAIALMARDGLDAVELLIDERAAREIAQRRGVPIVGFPGLLIRTCRQGMMTPEQVRDALVECQRQGTHYSTALITQSYERLRKGLK